MTKIAVMIDRLALSGIDPSDRQAFVAGLEAELTRSLADPATRAAWVHSHRTPSLRVDGGSFAPNKAGARKLGSQVAKGIGRGLKP